MKRFAELARRIDSSNKTNSKVAALIDYFKEAPPEDKVWAIALLTGRRPRRMVSPALLREWAAESAGIPNWLFEESYHTVGDLSETISLLVKTSSQVSALSLAGWMDLLISLGNVSEEERKKQILQSWSSLSTFEVFIFNKLISGNFRLGVSSQLVIRALSTVLELSTSEVTQKLTGNWSPYDTSFDELMLSERRSESQPYPFFLAYQLDQEAEKLGDPADWQAEWKWDGIRAQLIKREGQTFIWSRGDDLITQKFPELIQLGNLIPEGTVLDGEIVPFQNGQVLTFNILQTRLGRKTVSQSLLAKAPVAFFCYDMLELNGDDTRNIPLDERRKMLEELVQLVSKPTLLLASPKVDFDQWETLRLMRERSREYNSEGLMLKQKSSAYGTGRRKGSWWKWKVDPLSVDAVLIYAQKGSGRRAELYTDYTFALWNEGTLVPFAKAYSGLDDREIAQVNAFVTKNTVEKFGPVRRVTPELVFEIGFEGINKSSRHKSGLAVRFPRILKWRHDKRAEEADHLDTLKKLLDLLESG